MVALAVRDLSFSYREKPVFSGISFEAEKGEVLGLVGPNGSGKTTLIKCIDGILKPEGEISIFGSPISSMDRTDIARQIAYVPQSLPDGLSSRVFETILMGRKPHLNWNISPEDSEKVYRGMKLLGVEDYAFRKVKELSGGERQRVMIARSIVQETPVILMDEPTSNLDIRHQMEVMDTVSRLADEKGLTVIVSVHDLNLAARYCDKIVMLSEGSMKCFGTPADLLKDDIIRDVYGIEVKINMEFDRPYIIPVKPVLK
ncbi:ABC transporter ATP-binding protein [Methanoplanus limicola]|uniref:Cobalamin import ATP-binding protein BtuD n=1 Tax=Methanoplanus limicola DSM 2279 TaxID=937775 RepID=H1Z427_9EURY|nr:ABC transporter ATP-binding protein [Methanoplanus limicola]EHQ35706.1 ABC transporter related protein [Methanoplanus limicola DSM 2279]